MTIFEKLNGAFGSNFSSTGLGLRGKIRKLGASSDQKSKREKIDEHNRWVKVRATGDVPSPRSGHDVVVLGDKVYLFGGCGGESDSIACLNDMYVFDMALYKWTKVQYSGSTKPSPRASFGMCKGLTSDSFIIAGGTGVEMDSLRSDVLEFSTRTREWRKIKSNSDISSRFYGQTMCCYKNSLLFFGGSTGLHYTNDVFEYNLLTKLCRKLSTAGMKPSPRYKHQSVIVGDSMFIIGGGCFKPECSEIDMYRLDLKTLEWTKPTMEGSIPCARVAHSCSFDEETGTIYLWGGFTGELSRLQDFYSFDTHSSTWTEIKTFASEKSSSGLSSSATHTPDARAFHSATFYDGSLYLFSGANGDIRYSDVWRYTVRSSPPKLSTLAARELLQNSLGLQLLLESECQIPSEVMAGVLKVGEGAPCIF